MEEQTILRSYLDVLRRRRWLVVLAVLLTPAAAIVFSLHQTRLYQASAEVLLSHQNLAAALTNTTDPELTQLPDRLAQTQAELAHEPEVARRVLNVSREAMRDASVKQWTVSQFLAASSASAKQNADLLELSVTAPVPGLASRLATAYAYQFTAYRRELDTASFERALTQLTQRLTVLAKAHQLGSPLYDTLLAKQEQIRTMEALQTPNHVVRTAGAAVRVRPRPIRNGMLAVLLGCMLAIALAMTAEALDTRVRTAEEIRTRLGLPLLARIPKAPKKLRAKHRLVTEVAPNSFEADAFRLLRGNLEFANVERRAKTIMITSALAGEGKSTTAANLAVVLARSGKRVVLVDLDLRRPLLNRFFRLDDETGLTSVALGHLSLEEALTPVTISGSAMNALEPGASMHGRSVHGWAKPAQSANGDSEQVERSHTHVLEVLTAGPIPPDPGEFVGTTALTGVLAQLKQRADVVLVDGPPLLAASDGVTLSGEVDGIIIVSRLEAARRPVLDELRRTLANSAAAKLGFVLVSTKRADGYGYGYGFSSSGAGAPGAAEREPDRNREGDATAYRADSTEVADRLRRS
jgi:polysaccharide biosynthesis transport protein